jgi:hypothetical protein
LKRYVHLALWRRRAGSQRTHDTACIGSVAARRPRNRFRRVVACLCCILVQLEFLHGADNDRVNAQFFAEDCGVATGQAKPATEFGERSLHSFFRDDGVGTFFL